LAEFNPDKIKEKETEEKEDRKIMDLLGRFTGKMLKDALMSNGGHPKPEWGDGDSWRFYYHDECTRRGRKLLEQLGWPTGEDALYVNRYTGSIETLIEIVTDSFSSQRKENPIDYNVWTVIEHWEPYDPFAPNEFRIKHMEENLERLYKLKLRKKKDSYTKSDIKRIPEIEKEIAIEKIKSLGD
jgi:hypothetical protein